MLFVWSCDLMVLQYLVIPKYITFLLLKTSVLRSGSVRFFTSKWGNRNRNRSRTDPYIDGPRPDRIGPVHIGPWTKKNRSKPVFHRKICCANTTYLFLNNYYPDNIIVMYAFGHCKSPAIGLTFERFYQHLTEIWPKRKYIVLYVIVFSCSL